MKEAGWEKKKFLIDGFPRNEDNYSGWNSVMGDITELGFVLFFEADVDTMTKRIMERSKTSGRNDDNEETLRKRFVIFNEAQLPIITKFED
eukprot:CAMPEP_0176392570 /NCGR_PEP_ID=MMETSP0126-20121128/40978_1 /TAXON_ID=141414 ORGANISM="Strombidinopsis acuminatum, Strain SPMC142" /NCGR_SAMPLE_ID=MMETSP0126 /ASSEMBLY_ACC=CAM_ASM_000229 /LENGTH=90 /DNA_ID=CAMNT_0017763455 /DNA_START=1065 /DNA_END=1337 /DNA_ORIENTATION=-